MEADELSQLRKFEDEILSRSLKPAGGSGPAVPVGLRFDRLAREGFLPPAGRSEEPVSSRACAYWKCNCLAVSTLLEGSQHVLVACEESWAREVSLPAGDVPVPPAAVAAARLTTPFDAVLADSSVLLSGELVESLSRFRHALRVGGRVVLLVANWEYEMDGEPVRYEVSFKRYRGNVYAGLVKRTLEPPREVEYVCLLDPDEQAVRKLAELPRDELRRLGMNDVPGLGQLVIASDVIKIPQATVRSLEKTGGEAGFSRSLIAGAPGMPFVRAAGSPHLLAVFVA